MNLIVNRNAYTDGESDTSKGAGKSSQNIIACDVTTVGVQSEDLQKAALYKSNKKTGKKLPKSTFSELNFRITKGL